MKMHQHYQTQKNNLRGYLHDADTLAGSIEQVLRQIWKGVRDTANLCCRYTVTTGLDKLALVGGGDWPVLK